MKKFLILGCLLLSPAFVLTGCDTIGGVFQPKGEKPLEGERISVLELQKSLQPDDRIEGQDLSLPRVWQNEFWPQAGGYPNHSMQHLALNEEDGLTLKWRTGIGRGSTDELPLTAQPIVVDGIIYTMDSAAELSAFNIDNGERFWRVSLRNEDEDESVIAGGIAYASGRLYATNGFDEVLAIAPDTGNIIWRSDIPAPARAAPTIIDGRVFVVTLDNRLIALDSAGGSVLWEHIGLSEASGLFGAASPAANRDIVLPAFSSGEITALRVENGSVAWSDNLSNLRRAGGLSGLSDISALPVIDKGLVIAISFSGRLVAIDERTGQRVWQREISGSETPWVAGNNIFVLSEDYELVALSRDNGAIHWVTEVPRYLDVADQEDVIRWTGPILAGERLILASDRRQLLTVDPLSGQILDNTKIPFSVSIPPIVAGGKLYILSDDGRLAAYE